MTTKITVSPKWYGPVPTRNGKPLPKNFWARAGRKRKWSVRWRAIDGTRPRRTFDIKEQAEAFAESLTAELNRDGPQASIQPKDITLADFVAEYKRLRTGPKGTRLSEATMLTARAPLDRLLAIVGRNVPLANVTKAHAVRFVAELRNGEHKAGGGTLSEGTIAKTIATLKSFFSVAVNQLGYIRRNPFIGIRIGKLAPTEKRYVSRDEYFKLQANIGIIAPGRGWWEAFLAVCYSAGTRLNEAIMLTWNDIDFENDRIQVIAKRGAGDVQAWQPKDTDSRIIPIPAFAVDALTNMQTDAAEGNPYVFIGPDRLALIRQRKAAGEWVDNGRIVNNIRRQWLRIVKAAGIPHASVHDLRRSAITNWARLLPIHVVQELAGHSDIKTTQQFYLVVTDSDLDAARDASASALRLDPIRTRSDPE